MNERAKERKRKREREKDGEERKLFSSLMITGFMRNKEVQLIPYESPRILLECEVT